MKQLSPTYRVSVVIPALDEEQAIAAVLGGLRSPPKSDVVVVDNGSVDRTADVAGAHGARVVHEERRGYGRACLSGLDVIDDTDIVVFMDGDYSDCPQEISRLIAPILAGDADFVVGSRILGKREPGSLAPQQLYGDHFACWLMLLLFRCRYTDLGPFRAIRWDALQKLGMVDQDFGWTVEMQIKALRQGLRVVEVPVSYRRRIGKSKISGTLSGTLKAGCKILLTIARYARS